VGDDASETTSPVVASIDMTSAEADLLAIIVAIFIFLSVHTAIALTLLQQCFVV
jgi:hypothetical protein